jgi:transposase
MLNATSTISFFKKIEDAYPTKTKIHLFCDNARYYRNKAVTEYLMGSKIQLHFLPPYSPNLNPIERLWKWTKKRCLYGRYYANFNLFEESIMATLQQANSLYQHELYCARDRLPKMRVSHIFE